MRTIMKKEAVYTIREMQADDYEAVYALWSKTPGMGLSDADSYANIVRFLQKNKGLCFVCLDQGQIIGTALCGHDGRRGYLYHVTVAETYRSRGIGTALVESCLRRLKAEGIDKCHLFVFADNEPGMSFWRTLGWEKRDDVVVYSRNI